MISCIDRRVKRYSFGLVDLYKKFIILCRNEIGMLELVGQRFFSVNECSHAQSI